MELCYDPFELEDGAAASLAEPAGDAAGAAQRLGEGGGGAAARFARICAAITLAEAWEAYRDAWRE